MESAVPVFTLLAGLHPDAFRFKPDAVNVKEWATRNHEGFDLPDSRLNTGYAYSLFRYLSYFALAVLMSRLIDGNGDRQEMSGQFPDVIDDDSVLA